MPVIGIVPPVKCPYMGRFEHNGSPVIARAFIDCRLDIVLAMRLAPVINHEVRGVPANVVAVFVIDDPSVVRSIGAVTGAFQLDESSAVEEFSPRPKMDFAGFRNRVVFGDRVTLAWQPVVPALKWMAGMFAFLPAVPHPVHGADRVMRIDHGDDRGQARLAQLIEQAGCIAGDSAQVVISVHFTEVRGLDVTLPEPFRCPRLLVESATALAGFKAKVSIAVGACVADRHVLAIVRCLMAKIISPAITHVDERASENRPASHQLIETAEVDHRLGNAPTKRVHRIRNPSVNEPLVHALLRSSKTSSRAASRSNSELRAPF